MAKHRAAIWVLAAVGTAAAACGGSTAPKTALKPGGQSGAGGGGGGIGTGGAPDPSTCSDLFAPGLQTYSIDIDDASWAAIQSEFLSVGALSELDFNGHKAASYPIVFHYGGDTAAHATIHLRGDSSWREAAQFDGARGKMQFGIAFDDVDSKAAFHGVGKIKLDMPRTDPTFMRERIANTWMRSVGIPAGCATSAQLLVNGSPYGVFVAEETFGHRVLAEFFPGNSSGDLWDGGWLPQTNKDAPDWDRQRAFWAATTPDALTAIVDVAGSAVSWTAEALLNDADGYWGGDHNFYLYDQGAKGYVFIPHDLDSSLDYLDRFDSDPITWWAVRDYWTLPIPQHYLIVMHDDGLRRVYVEALRAQLGRWDVAGLQAAIDTAAGQIHAAVAADPHMPTDMTIDDVDTAIALARQGIADRASYVQSWLACWDGGTGADADGDGFIWCKDCRDDRANVHPGAQEICGNNFDDDCDGVVDNGCP